jgi:hypothetical protein
MGLIREIDIIFLQTSTYNGGWMADKFGNRFMAWVIRSPFGRMMGEGMVVITVRGRKTGREISTPINVTREGDTFTVVSSRERTWWRNLRDGAQATLQMGGKVIHVVGNVFETDSEVAAQLGIFLHAHPTFAKFYKVRINLDGQPEEDDLARVAPGRVVIKLQKVY